MKDEISEADLYRAQQWLIQHSRHVSNLVESEKHSVQPSGSDIIHPELWKGIHWNWYFEYTTKRDQAEVEE